MFVRQIDRIPGPPKVPFFGNVFGIPRDGSGNTPTILWGYHQCYEYHLVQHGVQHSVLE